MKTCSKCGISKELTEFMKRKSAPDGRRGVCKECKNAGNRQYRQDNLDTLRFYDSQYRKQRRVTDSVFLNKGREQYRSWRASNLDYDKKRQKKYRQENPEIFAYHAAQRRARRKNAKGSFTLEEWIKLCVAFGNICLACMQEKSLTVDHVRPLSKGGTNWIDNIQPLCGPCNSSKGANEKDYRMEV